VLFTCSSRPYARTNIHYNLDYVVCYDIFQVSTGTSMVYTSVKVYTSLQGPYSQYVYMYLVCVYLF
jgi:hypothetical protein